ncbi:MAG: HAD family hydrolase [Rubrivivax sp.]|nr:HAD family hydrolase [Rubrivivax sp.]
MRLALFDLDGTLLPGDSDHAFGQFLVQLGWVDGTEFARRNDAYFADYQRGRLDIGGYIEFITEPWRWRPQAEVEAASRRFIAEVIRPTMRPAAQELIERHRRAGDRLAIVTATNDFVTRPIAELLGVPDLIATELERDARGRVTGGIRGVPSFREGKVERVQAWLAGQGASLEGCDKSIFYSDSTNDLPLLERVSDPVATNPGPALERLARERGWPVLRLFE